MLCARNISSARCIFEIPNVSECLCRWACERRTMCVCVFVCFNLRLEHAKPSQTIHRPLLNNNRHGFAKPKPMCGQNEIHKYDGTSDHTAALKFIDGQTCRSINMSVLSTYWCHYSCTFCSTQYKHTQSVWTVEERRKKNEEKWSKCVTSGWLSYAMLRARFVAIHEVTL